jgi:FkbM family methyltransferase
VQLEDALGASWYDKDWPPPAELELLRRSRLKPGARVFDLGAHHGVVALVLAAEVGAGGRVLAVEAGAYEARLAERNRTLNGAANVDVLHAAVAERSGTLRFGVDGEVAAGESGAVEVPAFSIDDLAARHGDPDVLYIDVEGFECQALRGARRTLAGRPDCFVEIHHPRQLARYGGSQAEILELIPESAYERFFARSQDEPFQRLEDGSQLPSQRCFLVARARA